LTNTSFDEIARGEGRHRSVHPTNPKPCPKSFAPTADGEGCIRAEPPIAKAKVTSPEEKQKQVESLMHRLIIGATVIHDAHGGTALESAVAALASLKGKGLAALLAEFGYVVSARGLAQAICVAIR
jgi:hypothetical protein